MTRTTVADTPAAVAALRALATSARLPDVGSTVTREPSAPLTVTLGGRPTTVPSSGTAAVTATRGLATESTLNVTDPAPAFWEDETTAVAPVPVVVAANAVHDAGFAALVAASASEATLVLRACRAVTRPCAADCLDLSRVCGAASTCISWLMSAVVSRPLTMPSMPSVATSPSFSSRLPYYR